MPKQIPEFELNKIEEVVASFPSGAPLSKVHEKLSLPLSRRNVQHRLALLVEKGRIIAEGRARGRIYTLPTSEEPQKAAKSSMVPLTDSSRELVQLVRRPIQQRNPVGYERDFLESYQPNESYYLPDSVRKHLAQKGKTDGDRPAGTYAREIHNRLRIDLAWNSSRLEGNTYSILETQRLLEKHEVAKGKNSEETQMILNHKAAIEFLIESVDEIGINQQTFLNLHALLSENLLSNPKACGRIRTSLIGIAKSVYHPLGIPTQVEECFQQIIMRAQMIEDPFEQAFFLIVHLPYLQPFEDVNKRVSRLGANIPLITQNLAPLSFVDVPQEDYISGLLAVYELNRIELLKEVFIWAYERSARLYSTVRQETGDPDPFRIRYRTFIKEVVAQIVIDQLNPIQAIRSIREYAQKMIPSVDQPRFIETIEIELQSLHSGNFARYPIRQANFEDWFQQWNR